MSDEFTRPFRRLYMFKNRLATLDIARCSCLPVGRFRRDVGDQTGRHSMDFLSWIWGREKFEGDLEEGWEVGIGDLALANIGSQGAGYT